MCRALYLWTGGLYTQYSYWTELHFEVVFTAGLYYRRYGEQVLCRRV